jgi:hypothetical protein
VSLTRPRTTIPLVALLTLAVLAMLLAAQTSLACTDKIALPIAAGAMPMMPGMDMSSMQSPGGSGMMICPIVLALIVASALLTLAAIGLLWRDPHRALTRRTLAGALAHLPPARTAAILLCGGAISVVAMMGLEHSTPPALPVCAMLVALLVACALTATVVGIVAGRIALALGQRLIVALVAVVAYAADAGPLHVQRLPPRVDFGYAVPVLAAGRGLRAPPLFVR